MASEAAQLLKWGGRSGGATGCIGRRALGARFDTVSYSDFEAKFTDFRQLVRARSRLYRSRFLQPNTNFCSIFRNLQDDHSFPPPPIQYFSKFSSESFCKFSNFPPKFTIFSQCSSNCAQILMKFSRNFAKFRREC